jgi:hypothetical protein
MIEASSGSPNVFLFTIAPGAGVAPEDLDAALLAQSGAFGVGSRADLAPAVFEHRVLRGDDGSRVWQIAFEGLDIPAPEGEPSGSLRDALLAEVKERLEGRGEVVTSAAYVDLSLPPPGLDYGREPEGAVSFADEEIPWEDYASDSGKAGAGAELPDSILADIAAARASIPVEPGLKAWGKGHIYFGNSDKAHIAYLKGYFEQRAAQASPSDRRKIIAFRAFQSREGSTAAINTYDNQIVTWGTGWGGLGLMGKVVARAVTSRTVRDRFGSAGVRYRAKNVYDVVDLKSKRVVTGSKPALEAMRGSLPLLYLLIQIARDPGSRDAATDAQLLTFMESSANIPRSDEVATQALFNLITHLKHWAPAYVIGCLEWALPKAGGGEPSVDRDRILAPLIGRYFYGKARKYKWIPDWKQFQLYWKHMKDDGLDCLSDPFITATAPPAEDPFVGDAGPAQPPAASPVPAQPAAQPSPAPSLPVLKNAPLAGHSELESILRGAAPLRRGAKGAAVKAVQEALVHLGYTVAGGADGAFGPAVERAVKAFQEKSCLEADGAVGAGTLKALDEMLGPQRAAT